MAFRDLPIKRKLERVILLTSFAVLALMAAVLLMYEPGAPRGLGLPVMRGLVELDGGSCGFEMPTIGLVEFYFVLPSIAS